MRALRDRVECLYRRQEVGGDELGTLMYKLVEGMLPVRSALTPNNRARLICYATSVFRDEFTVRFHVALKTPAISIRIHRACYKSD